MRWLSLIALVTFFFSCVRSGIRNEVQLMAYVPVYATTEDAGEIEMQDARPTSQAGKIYAYQHYIFQNELYEGIHIVDNSDAQRPAKKAFLKIPFNTDMAIRGNYIYANSVNDLVVIDITNPLQPQTVNRVKEAFPMISQSYPPERGYFVCPDPLKGVVVDWKLETVNNASCRR